MRNSKLLPIFLIVFVDVLGFTFIIPLLPFYAESLGATPAIIGLLIATYGLCQFIAGPPLGRLSDRIGRKPVLLVSQIGTLSGFLLLGFSHTLTLVFLSRAIDGITAGNITVAQAYISDVTEPKNRTRAFGLIGVAFGLGFLIGPAASGILAHFGQRFPIWGAACLSATSITATLFLLPKVDKTARTSNLPAPGTRPLNLFSGITHYFRFQPLASFLVQFLTFGLSFGLFTSGLALFCERRLTWHGQPFQTTQVGYIFAYAGAIGLLIQGKLMAPLVNRFGERRLVGVGFVGMAIGYFLLGWVSSIPLLLIAITAGSAGSSLLRPALSGLISQTAPRSEQGAVMGTSQSLIALAQIVGPIISGWLINNEWLTSWAWLCAFFPLVGFALLVRTSTLRPSTASSADN